MKGYEMGQPTTVIFNRLDAELTEKQHAHIKEILEYMLRTLDKTGDYTVNAEGAAKQGRGSKPGVHIGIANEHGIAFTYQPEKSKKKALFTIALGYDEAVRIQQGLKNMFPKPVKVIPKVRREKPAAPTAPPEPVETLQPPQLPAASAYFIEEFSPAKNREHAVAFAQVAQERAKAYTDAVLPKSEATQLLAEFMGLDGAFGVGPKLLSLLSQGYLTAVGEEAYLVEVENPKPGKSYTRKKATPSKEPTSLPLLSDDDAEKVQLTGAMKKFFDDTQKMQDFFTSCVRVAKDADYINGPHMHSLLDLQQFPAGHAVTYRKFLRFLCQEGFMVKSGRSSFQLTEMAIAMVAAPETAAVLDASVPPTTPAKASTADTNQLLAAAVKTKRKLQQQLQTAQSELAVQRQQNNQLTQQIAQLQAELATQADTEALVQERVQAELVRMLESE